MKYQIKLSPLMIIGIVKIATGDDEIHPKTKQALLDREMVSSRWKKLQLSKKGHAFLEACRFEYRSAERFIEAILEEAA